MISVWRRALHRADWGIWILHRLIPFLRHRWHREWWSCPGLQHGSPWYCWTGCICLEVVKGDCILSVFGKFGLIKISSEIVCLNYAVGEKKTYRLVSDWIFPLRRRESFCFENFDSTKKDKTFSRFICQYLTSVISISSPSLTPGIVVLPCDTT